ncbi:MAG: polysaccharide deacetylase family protein [Fuerstiella sp.]|nr:polysaccharide deacetylase family protein [Fuerstiella sp.]MCP4854416.1 polysaccharide deacetylase family protein [Fuerstiella sp.]
MAIRDAGVATLLKTFVHRSIRSVHETLCNRGLPTKIGVYFHSIESGNYDAFREMAEFFHAEGYRFTNPDTFLTDPDERCVYVSFDDNYKAWHDAIPLFDALDITATFFVNTVCVRDKASDAEIAAYYERLEFDGTRIPLSTSELRELDSAGHTIGAHTHSHFQLTALSFEQAQAEILRSKNELEEILGRPVLHFSYPFGMRRHFSEQLRSWCMDVGFSSVSNAIPCLLHAGHKPSGLNRCLWNLEMPPSYNLSNISIDGRHFVKITGRSVVG